MKTQQSGSVLAISLVLLTAITLIAIMGIERAGLQTKIVGAIQHKEQAFNSALSELDCIYRDIQKGENQPLSDALNSISNTATTGCDIDWNNRLLIETTITHIEPLLDAGKAVTSSIRDDNSRGKNGAGIEKFEIATTTTLPNKVKSAQMIGTRYLMPE